jgi:predicted Zn-dependent protease
MRLPILLILGCLAGFGQGDDYERARRLLANGRPAEAAAIYRQLLRAQPRSSDLYVNLSVAEYKAARFHEAAASASEALKIAPDLLPARLFLGASYLELARFEEAVEALERVVAADPRERNGQLMLAEALAGAGDPKRALAHFRAATELLPTNPRALYGLASACEAVGEKAAAAAAWAKLSALPASAQSHMRNAEVFNQSLRWQEASREWNEALKKEPANRKARYGLAWSQFRNRDYDTALQTLEPLLSTPTVDVQFVYGASLLNLQRPSEAVPYLQSALDLNPALVPARAALGQALLQMGKPEDAIPLLAAARSIDGDGAIHFQLFRAYQLTHKTDEARRALASYQRLRSKLAPDH